MKTDLELYRPTQLELFTPAEVVRPDVNIAKWAGWIFASPWAKGLYESKKHSWKATFEDREVEASLTVKPLHGQKRPTVTTQRVYYGFIQLWEQSGRPATGEVIYSDRQLASIMNKKWGGQSTASMINEQVDVLNGTMLKWLFSFENREGREQIVDDMNLIERKTYYSKELFSRKKLFTKQQKVVLNSELVKNMLEGKTKPFNHRVFSQIKNDYCASLYSILDIFLSNKNHWERRSLPLLIDDLGFEGKRYEKRRLRLAKLKEFVKILSGKNLSNGILSLSIEKTADGEDYKLVAHKVPRIKKSRRPPKLANDKEDIPLIVEDILDGLSLLGSVRGVSEGILEVLSMWYSREMLIQALSILKADYRGNIKKSPISAYMYKVHVLAHDRNLEWISNCGTKCKHRPENRKQLKFS